MRFIILLSLFLSNLSFADLNCTIEKSDEKYHHSFPATEDIYSTKSIKIDGSFLIRPMVYKKDKKIEWIKIYSYYVDSKDIERIIHIAEFKNPELDTFNTGTQFIYSPMLEREMKYSCNWGEK